MPVYEYRCLKCRHKVTAFFKTISEVAAPACDRCGSSEVVRLMSTFSLAKSAESRMDDLDSMDVPPDLDENDPKSIGRYMRKMKGEIGEDAGPEFDEMVDRLEAGEMPDELAGDGGEGLGEAGGMEE